MTQILMPALSPTMEEGNLAKWLVKVGDKIEPGQVIAEIETDKATMEVEAVDEGVVSALLVAEGAQGVKVNTPIAVLDGEACKRTRQPPPRGGGGREAAGGGARATPAREPRVCTPLTPGPLPHGGGEQTLAPGSAHAQNHPPRRAARRDGGRNAPRSGRVSDGRGGRGISGRVQSLARVAGTNSAPRAWSIRRSPSTALPASASARRWRG